MMSFKFFILFTIGILVPNLSAQDQVTYKLKRSLESNYGCKMHSRFDNQLVYESNGLNFYDVNQDVILKKKIDVSLPRWFIVLKNGNLAVVDDNGNTIEIWDAENVVKVLSVEVSKGFFNTVKDLKQLPNEHLVTVTYEHEVKVWDLNDGSLVTSLPKSGYVIQTIALPGNRLAIVYRENNLIIWSSEGKIIHELKQDPNSPTRINLIYSLPSGSLLYNFNNSVYALDLEKLNEPPVLVIPNSGEVWIYSLADNGDLAVAEKIYLNNGFYTSNIKIYRSDTFELIKTLAFKDIVTNILTLSNGYLAILLKDLSTFTSQIKLFDLVNLKEVSTISYNYFQGLFSVVGFEATTFAVCTDSFKIDIWSL